MSPADREQLAVMLARAGDLRGYVVKLKLPDGSSTWGDDGWGIG